MHFELTEEQKLLQTSVREFCEQYVEPIAAEVDHTPRWPEENVKRLAEMDWLGIPYPEEYGGAGADFLSYIITIEELSRACATTGFIAEINTLAAFGLYKFGTEEQKQKYMVPMCKGEKLGCFALTEPGAGTDVASASSTAKLDGDEYVINGSKIFISSAPAAEIFNVYALTDKSKGAKGLSCFIVPKGTPGLSIGKHLDKMGIRGALTSEVILKDCRVPKENLLGKEGDGFKIAMMTLDTGRVAIAAQALGIAQAALDESVHYAKERVQFGKPIAKLQAIQWMIAEMAADVQSARLLTYHAAWCHDQGGPFGMEAAMAKLKASECAARHTNRAIQVHGGIGFIKGHKVERLYRDAKITEIYEGTSEVMKLVIAGSKLK